MCLSFEPVIMITYQGWWMRSNVIRLTMTMATQEATFTKFGIMMVALKCAAILCKETIMCPMLTSVSQDKAM